MEVVHLTTRQLAARWSKSRATLECWRCKGIGPHYLKLSGRVLYRLDDIEAYEEARYSKNISASTTSPSR